MFFLARQNIKPKSIKLLGINIAIRQCAACPSQKTTIVETCHDPINQVTLYIYLDITDRLCSLERCLVCTYWWVASLVTSVLVCSFALFLFLALPLRVAIHGWISLTVDCRCFVSAYATTAIMHVPGVSNFEYRI